MSSSGLRTLPIPGVVITCRVVKVFGAAAMVMVSRAASNVTEVYEGCKVVKLGARGRCEGRCDARVRATSGVFGGTGVLGGTGV